MGGWTLEGGREGLRMSSGWARKRVDRKAEGGLPRKGEGPLEGKAHEFLVEPCVEEWMVDSTATGQSRQGLRLPRSPPEAGFGIRSN